MNLSRALPLSLFLLLAVGFVVAQDRKSSSTPKGPGLSDEENGWQLREMELMARIRGLELELVQERALRLKREQEWMEFTKLLALLPEERRPELPSFLGKKDPVSGPTEATPYVGPTPEEVEAQHQLRRAASASPPK
ncbi:MAG: hypothetical protein GY930_01220 [bacterium]|nr:hypothetical protein [bacterium]